MAVSPALSTSLSAEGSSIVPPAAPVTVSLLFTWSLASLSAPLPPLLAPLAPAVASARLSRVDSARMVTLPSELPLVSISRSTLACAVSRAIVAASVTPTATLSPAALASPSVVVLLVWVVNTSTVPVPEPSVMALPSPIRAVVLLMAREIATAGLTEILPEEPATTVVSML